MSREQNQGVCDKCSREFRYYLVHNGFNDSGYAYCDSCCYVAIIGIWTAPRGAPSINQGAISPEVEAQLLPCPSRGHFRGTAHPRCPHCNEPFDAVRAAEWIERNAPGTAKGWQWQRSWDGLYCIVVEERKVDDPWKLHHCT